MVATAYKSNSRGKACVTVAPILSKLMKALGTRSVLRRKFVITTDSTHDFPIATNVLNRESGAAGLGKKWVSDITYVRVKDHWNYLTTIIGLADRKVVGRSLSEDMTTQNTVVKAYLSATGKRTIQKGFIFHSDRGVQYAPNKTTQLFSFNWKSQQSMSRKGNCWDNAVAGSFFKTIKHEWLYRFKYQSYSQLYKSIDEYISWYNPKRLHSSLRYRTPLEMEMKLKNLMNNAA